LWFCSFPYSSEGLSGSLDQCRAIRRP
jgi:hypothetical protein